MSQLHRRSFSSCTGSYRFLKSPSCLWNWHQCVISGAEDRGPLSPRHSSLAFLRGNPHSETEAGPEAGRTHGRAAAVCLVLEGPGAEPGLVTDGLDLGIGLLTRQATAGPWGPCSDEVSQQLLWLILWKSTFCVRNVLKRKTECASFLPPACSHPPCRGIDAPLGMTLSSRQKHPQE